MGGFHGFERIFFGLMTSISLPPTRLFFKLDFYLQFLGYDHELGIPSPERAKYRSQGCIEAEPMDGIESIDFVLAATMFVVPFLSRQNPALLIFASGWRIPRRSRRTCPGFSGFVRIFFG